MPELAEVERAAQYMKRHAQGKQIREVETVEDNIVFSGVSHSEFGEALTGRIVNDVRRYGKVFFMTLEGAGPMPVFHFGMTGSILIKGEAALVYKENPKKPETQWPPRFCKFVMHLRGPSDSSQTDDTEIAFVDARRLGRIRLCNKPMEELPISALGFDPVLSMPGFETFADKVRARSCPIKSLLLDQSFSAGVGNWIADEVLYHSRLHPEQRANQLNNDQLKQLYDKLKYVCEFAVSVNADHTKFPENWLFIHRWGKGKGKARSPLKLPSGEPATIKWITAAGRTSAFVVELQRKPSNKENENNGRESDLADLDGEKSMQESAKRKRTQESEPAAVERIQRRTRSRGTRKTTDKEVVTETERTKTETVRKRTRKGE